MRHAITTARRWTCHPAVLLSLAIAQSAVAQRGQSDLPPRTFLYKDSRGELAKARAQGSPSVTLVIAAMPGQAASVARTIATLGGTIRYRDDDVDYLRAAVPVERVEALLHVPGIEAADIATSEAPRPVLQSSASPTGIQVSGRQPALLADTEEAWPPPHSDYPLRHPYSPLADLGASEFRTAHPTFDGRGVTIAVLDGTPDLLLPELQTGTALGGRAVPKFVDVVNVVDPDDSASAQWVSMADTVRAADGMITYRGTRYTTPHDGRFRIGLFDERRFDSPYLGHDINRDGNPPGSSRLFGVLWDESMNTVWVDVNQDHNFADEKALTDYRLRGDIGTFGTDNPATPVREAIAFTVQTNQVRKYVAINAGFYQHSTLVSGALAGNRRTGGRFDGVAPGARLVSIWYGETTYGLVEGLIRAFKDPAVDVVLLEQNVFIAQPYRLGDGRFAPSIICSRLIARSRKPFLVPADNNSSLNSVTEHAQAIGALGIGAYQAGASYLINDGVRVEHDDNLHFVGSYGPAGNGALKPDVLSPSNVLSTFPAFMPGEGVKGLFQLPPGYTIAGGTSTATPVAAGAVALLISAAKQSGVPYDAMLIRRALLSSARYIPCLPAYKQGNGLIQVGAAWELLRRLAMQRTPIVITSRAPVRTVYSSELPVPNEGVGLWEREGWAAGMTGTRTIIFERRSGPRGPMRFALTWQGNDGTFAAPESISLPLNVPVAVLIHVAPATDGVHSAILTLDQPRVPGHAYRMLATIVAARPLDERTGYTTTIKAAIPRPGSASFYIDVPPGTSALRVALDTTRSGLRLQLNPPDGREILGDPWAMYRNVLHPQPGVWEIVVWNINDAFQFDWSDTTSGPLPATPVTLTATALGASVAITPPGTGGMSAGRVTVQNRMAAFRGAVTSAAMGATRQVRDTIDAGGERVYEIHVPEGATLLQTSVSAVDSASDLDLYLFDCTTAQKGCVPHAAGITTESHEVVAVVDPAAGAWKVVVDAPSVPSGHVTYDYTDVVLDPVFGSVSVADAPQARAVGASWDAAEAIWTACAAGDERRPYALLRVLGWDSTAMAPYVVGEGVLPVPKLADPLSCLHAASATRPAHSGSPDESRHTPRW